MNKTTRDFIEIAYSVMKKAYYNEVSANNNDFNADIAKRIGEVLQAVGDLSRTV